MNIDTVKKQTAEAFENPSPGDIFHEMWSCWLRVHDVLHSEVTGDKVVIWQWNNSKRQQGSIADFKNEAAYKSIPGYSVLLHSRDGKSVTQLQGGCCE